MKNEVTLFEGIIDPKCPSCRVVVEFMRDNKEAELICDLTRDSTYLHIVPVIDLPEPYKSKWDYAIANGEYPDEDRDT